MNTLLITQARISSTRLHGKVLKTVNGKMLIEIHLERIRKARRISNIVVATTVNSSDDILYDRLTELGYKVFRGSENDVLDRFYQCASEHNPEWIVRVTSDCPLLDPALIDDVVSFVQNHNVDYGTNVIIENFPDGQDIEVFKFSALKNAWLNATKMSDREHVTSYIRNNSSALGGKVFSSINYPCHSDFSKIRMTVDEGNDFLLMEKLIKAIGIDRSWEEYTEYILNNNLQAINKDIIRNEGYINSLKKD